MIREVWKKPPKNPFLPSNHFPVWWTEADDAAFKSGMVYTFYTLWNNQFLDPLSCRYALQGVPRSTVIRQTIRGWGKQT